MIELGKYNDLVAYRQTDNGWYLTDETGEEVLLPNKFIPEGMEKGTEINVFIFLDNEERLTATTQKPLVNLHEFAMLEVKDVNRYGAFVDWGLDKQLMIPYAHQSTKMQVGKRYLCYLFIDKVTNRLLASNKVYKFLDNETIDVKEGDEVNLIILNTTNLGINVIVNQKYKGLVFHDTVFQKLKYGSHQKGFVKTIREENKIDIILEKQGYKNVIDKNTEKVLQVLNESNGYSPFNDFSDPDDIRLNFQMSKKNFKKAIGALYRQKQIEIEEDGIYLV